MLTVVDQWSRRCASPVAAQGTSGHPVAEALAQAIARHGKRRPIKGDRGTEFTSRALDNWAYRRGVRLDPIRPGMSVENGLIESLNGQPRD